MPDLQDAFPLDPGEWLDTDGDGTGNNTDDDDDNDGWLDTVELTAGSDPVCDFSIPNPAGDGNGDMQVDIADMLLLSRILLGVHTPTLAEQQQLNVAPLVGGTPAPDCNLNTGDLVVGFRKILGIVDF